ncbi:asparagine synthase (glutamine-hydrolyzing) [Nocardia sp. X0981]
MCRIFGCFGKHATPAELMAASGRQITGGPDTQRFVSGAEWSLGINRLAIVNPAGGGQPFRLGRITAVYNGEIYNHHDLRRDLAKRGHTVPDRCDGAVLPALYAEYGVDFLDRLDGMYSIAVVDERTRPQLILATDHAGMKPLYWSWSADDRVVYFASEPRGLFSFSDVPVVFDDEGLDRFLALKYRPGPATMFRGVSALQPGQTLVVRDGEISTRHREPGPVRTGRQDLDSVLTDAVDDLLAADVPVCAVTSGGLDSSLITSLAAERASELHTFNIGYVGDWQGDERGYAAEVADLVGTQHHQVLLDPADIPRLTHEMALATGQPNGAPIAVSTYKLFEQISAAGFRVALTGDGADEIFGGYWHAREAVAAGRTQWWPTYAESLISIPHRFRMSLYSSDYRASTAGPRSVESWLTRARPDTGEEIFDGLTEFELATKFPYYHLMRVDHLSMAHSVEVRLPFCQRAVIDFARELPMSAKLGPDRGKLPLYDIARSRLPRAVLDRQKQPFTLPIAEMLWHVPALFEFVAAVVTDPATKQQGFLDPTACARLLTEFRARPTRTGAQALWSLTVHQVWRNAFVSEFRRSSAGAAARAAG